MTGQTFGSWTVIGRSEKRQKKRAAFWDCRCVCGVVRPVVSGNLRTGISTNCGCMREPYLIELKPGQMCGSWMVIGRGPSGKCGDHALWECVCVCGKVSYQRSGGLRRGTSTNCGCLRTYAHNSYADDDDRAYVGRFNTYREGAKRRGLPFELDLAEFITITKLPCTYCGSPPSLKVRRDRVRRPTPYMSGLDRIDNDKGYVQGNCAPCCTWCNEMKLHRTAESFLAHVEKIVSWQNR